jgi:excisionase family DNA binding protein
MTDDEDWAITPPVFPLERLFAASAGEDTSGPQSGRKAREASGKAPPVLTVDELAALLRVERKTVYAAIARGEIPGVRRVGSLLRVSRDSVLTWLAQGQDRVSRSRRSP